LSNSKNCAIVLDFDGVMTSLDVDWKVLHAGIEAKLNLTFDSFADFFERNYGSLEFERVSDLVKQTELEAVKRSEPYSDVLPALEMIRNEGSKAYISSMQSRDVLNYFLEKFELVSYFESWLGRENGGSKRSQLEQIKNSVSKKKEYSSVGNRLYLVDDLARNISVGRNLGYESILFKREKNSKNLVDIVASLLE
jgi:phosphoglycolate phosphatase-like HAD superfamily hydrolase